MRRLRLLARLAAATWADARDALLGPRCRVTGDRVFPADRPIHHDSEHPGEGRCA